MSPEINIYKIKGLNRTFIHCYNGQDYPLLNSWKNSLSLTHPAVDAERARIMAMDLKAVQPESEKILNAFYQEGCYRGSLIVQVKEPTLFVRPSNNDKFYDRREIPVNDIFTADRSLRDFVEKDVQGFNMRQLLSTYLAYFDSIETVRQKLGNPADDDAVLIKNHFVKTLLFTRAIQLLSLEPDFAERIEQSVRQSLLYVFPALCMVEGLNGAIKEYQADMLFKIGYAAYLVNKKPEPDFKMIQIDDQASPSGVQEIEKPVRYVADVNKYVVNIKRLAEIPVSDCMIGMGGEDYFADSIISPGIIV